MVRNLPAMQETGFDPWVRKIPWRRAWQPIPVLSPGEFHGQRSLVGYSPCGHKELDMIEQLTLPLFFIHTHTHTFVFKSILTNNRAGIINHWRVLRYMYQELKTAH